MLTTDFLVGHNADFFRFYKVVLYCKEWTCKKIKSIKR